MATGVGAPATAWGRFGASIRPKPTTMKANARTRDIALERRQDASDDEQIVTGSLPRCARCGARVTMRCVAGPGAEQNAPCGCDAPTVVTDGGDDEIVYVVDRVSKSATHFHLFKKCAALASATRGYIEEDRSDVDDELDLCTNCRRRRDDVSMGPQRGLAFKLVQADPDEVSRDTAQTVTDGGRHV